VWLSILLLTIPGIAQETTVSPYYQDSLLRHISREGSAELSCYFTYSRGRSGIDAQLNNNANELARLDHFLRFTLEQPELHIERIRLTGYSSVEGSYSHNELLARERVESLYLHLSQHYPGLGHYPFDMAWVAEDWTGLAKLARESGINELTEINEIIRKIPSFDERETLLVKLNGGRAYREIENTIFPRLRRVEIEVIYTGNASQPKELKEPAFAPWSAELPRLVQRDPIMNADSLDKALDEFLDQLKKEFQSNVETHGVRLEQGHEEYQGYEGHEINKINEISEPIEVTSNKEEVISNKESDIKNETTNEMNRREQTSFANTTTQSPPPSSRGGATFALKTNLLSWAGVQSDFSYVAPVANLALEWYVTPSWSVELGASYAYWRYNDNKEFLGHSGYRLEPRYRFALIGNWFGGYLGAYGRVGDYDRQTLTLLDPQGDLEAAPCRTGKYWDAGISAGLNVRLFAGWALELGARYGYVSTDVMMYTKEGSINWYDGKEAYSKTRVTDLNVSLIYRFRPDNGPLFKRKKKM